MKKKECHIIPEEEKQCVWMTSGLISYKLCTRDYQCEECMFDQVIRNEAAAEGAMKTARQPVRFDPIADTRNSSLNTDSALFHHLKHCWAKVESPDDVWIGIDGILAKFVSRIKAVALPKKGDEIRQGDCFAHIIQEKHIMPLYSPVSGEVLFANNRLEKKPELLNSSFWDKGWLVRIKPDSLENDLKALMFGKKASQWYQKKEHEVVTSSLSMIDSAAPDIGATMHDGGERLHNLADMLTTEQYAQIMEFITGAEDPA